MKSSHAALIAALLLGACAAQGGGSSAEPAPVPGPPAEAAQGAAKQGLATLPALVTPQNFRGLGFESPDEARRAQLGSPLPIYSVDLESLRRYTPSMRAEDVIANAQRSLFPVMVDGRVATAIIVTGRTDGWRATDFGNAALARATTAQRRSPEDVIVQIPAAKLVFIGRGSGARMTLTPIMDDDRFGLKSGEALPASRVLLQVQRGMADYNGLPQ
jgi:hypothetical protein